jgi:hypothetical protein
MKRDDQPAVPSAAPQGNARTRFRAWLSQPATRRSNLAGLFSGLLWGVIWSLWLLSQRNAAPEPSVMGSVMLLIPVALFFVGISGPSGRAGRMFGWCFLGGAVLGSVAAFFLGAGRILGYF